MRALWHIFGVWLALLALLALTVALSFALKGMPSLAASIAIAAAKAGLIFWFYMHVREKQGIVRVAAVAAFLWLAILTAGPITDYLTR
jgi:cytochrome c oxidase subunit 4